MPFLKTDDVELFYTDEGEGPPVLFVHGWTCDSHDWIWQYDAFIPNHRVIAFDNRGHGMSSAPLDGYEPKTFAADIAALLNQLNSGPVVAVGHSLGGSIVAALAVEYPDLVRGVVEVDPAYGLAGAYAGMLDGMLEMFATADVHETSARLIEAQCGPSTPEALRAWRRRRIFAMRPDVLRTTFSALYTAQDQFGLRPATDAYLARRKCPVLTVTADAVRGGWEEEIFQDEYSRVVAIEGFGHWLHQEQPDEFNRLVLEWIDQIPST